MNEITGIKQHIDLFICCLIIKKLQKLGTKIDAGGKDCSDPTGERRIEMLSITLFVIHGMGATLYTPNEEK